jgi:starvation-inducible DNA-binding protein
MTMQRPLASMPRLAEVKELPDRVREMPSLDNPVIDHLQLQIANTIVLFMNYKQYHWQVAGPLSANLEALFNEFSAEMLSLLDRFAERLCVVGSHPMMELGEVQRRATVDSAGVHGNLRDVIGEAHSNSQRQVAELRHAVRAATNCGDPGSMELFSSAIRTQEKHEWSLRRILRAPFDVLEMAAAPTLS